MNKKFVVGSRAFFAGYEDFNPNDSDFLELVDDPVDFKWRREFHLRGVCTFAYKREPIADMVQRTLDNGDPLLICKFLTPEVAYELGASVADILPLEALVPKLDDKHRYYAVIFDAYKVNGAFTLTQAQRDAAYAEYKKARMKEVKKKEEKKEDE